MTLRTHALPEFFGGAFATVRATSDDAYRRLVAKTVEFYAQALFNPHWGEQIGFGPGGVVAISMVFQGLTSATGRGCLASVFRLGLRFASGFRPRVGAADRRVPGPAFLGPFGTQVAPGTRPRRRSRGRAGGRYILGGKPGGSRRRLARLPIRLAARVPPRVGPARTPRRRACRRRSASRDAACQQGPCGRDAGGDRRGQGNRDEPSGRRRLRAGDQRRARTARLSRRSRP